MDGDRLLVVDVVGAVSLGVDGLAGVPQMVST
jgi:hypothetical protein